MQKNKIMKNIFLFITTVYCLSSSAQTKLNIQYDVSGNRFRQRIHCLTESKDSLEPSLSRLEIFPNPANTQTILSFRVEQAGKLEIKLFSPSNVMVKEIYSGPVIVDNYQFDIDLNNLPSAIYFIRLQLADRAKNYKLVVIH